MMRLVGVSRCGRYAAVRGSHVLWIDDAVRGPHPVALPCDGDFAFAGDDLWVSHGATLARFALPSLQRREELAIAAVRLLGDGDRVVVRTADGWLVQHGASLVAIATAPGEHVFPIGGGRRVHARGGRAHVVDTDGSVRDADLGGAIAYAAPGLGRGWLALVDRDGDHRELVVVGSGHRVVRRIGLAIGAAIRSGGAGGRAVVVTQRGQLLVVDLRTGDIGALDVLAGDRLDVACDATGQRVVAAARTRDALTIRQSVLAAA